MGNYHHHQNPSAFNLDLTVISNICSMYAADGLYTIDSTVHSPLIGFAYDGFPIYGAYGYKNADGTGGIVRIKSSYSLRNITTRTTSPTGATVPAGPVVSATYPLGYFREDYQYNPTSASTPDYLDEHNGRFCVTPEYPNGIYCYFATVDANWNSAYPYVVGPTFYGVVSASRVNAITEPVTVYVSGPITTPTVASLDCGSAIIAGNAYVNIPFAGNASVTYTGGNGVAFAQGTAIASTGVTGLTATLQSGTLNNGNGNLQFSITGTPTASGIASFAISFGGQACTMNVTVAAASGGSNVFDFTVQPNPIEDAVVRVKFASLTNIAEHVWIYDAAGRLIKSLSLPNLANGIDVRGLAAGTYSIKIQDQSSKVVKVKQFVKGK
jgi:hypothetical protein